MADRLEAAIMAAMDEVFGDRFEATGGGERPHNSNPHFLQMLSVAGDQDDDTRDLIRLYLEMKSEIDDFRDALAKLMTDHDGDESYERRCRSAFRARADLYALQQQHLLADWWPGLRYAGRPM